MKNPFHQIDFIYAKVGILTGQCTLLLNEDAPKI